MEFLKCSRRKKERNVYAGTPWRSNFFSEMGRKFDRQGVNSLCVVTQLGDAILEVALCAWADTKNHR